MVKLAPEFFNMGLPFLTFMVLGSYGLAELLAPNIRETDMRKRYVEPEKTEDVLKKMQEKLANQEFEIVPVPGSTKLNLNTMNREQLRGELQNIRDSEVWTGIKMSEQKLAVKMAMKALANK